ncbi:MAG: restriction endonuclease subunit S [Chlorobium sp.]|jgi:type I restriction enzyme S subunit|nr:restriction endonuclease subunit S [Chlorobium sp.]
MSRYQRYPAYRDSGVEWIGEIPGHWECIKIKHLSQVQRGASPRPIDDQKYFDDEGEYSWVRISDVTASNKYLECTEQRLSEIGKTLSIPLQPGQLFLSIAGSVGKPIITKINCCIHDGFVYFPYLKECTDFLYYIFLSGQPFLGLGKMGTQLNLNTDTVGSISIPVPPLDEQQAIASFLDRKTAEIDELITKKEELLKKLDEKRTALITRAVTNGLDPSAPMKESGLKWLGEIPTHWEVKKLKYVTDKVQTGTTPQSNDDEYFLDTTIIWYTPSDFSDQSLMLTDSKRKLNKIAIENGIVKIIPAGSVLVIGIGATLGKVGLSINQCCCNQQINGISPNRLIDAKFLLYSLLIKQEIMKLISNATTLGIMNQEKTKSIQLCIPPLEEQQVIAEQIEKKTAIIDRQKAQVTEAIERLNEYRSALITDAVTGKMNVHSHQPREILSA